MHTFLSDGTFWTFGLNETLCEILSDKDIDSEHTDNAKYR